MYVKNIACLCQFEVFFLWSKLAQIFDPLGSKTWHDHPKLVWPGFFQAGTADVVFQLVLDMLQM